jgi:hypothetical protein
VLTSKSEKELNNLGGKKYPLTGGTPLVPPLPILPPQN